MRHTLGLAIAEGNHINLFLAVQNRRSAFAIGQCHPAGIQAQFLRFEHQLLPAVSECFLQRRGLRSDQSNIILDALKLAVMRHDGFETSRIIIDDLHMQSVLLVE